jgi:hypothetical protein
MPRFRLRNQRREISSHTSGSDLACLLHVTAWLQCSQWDGEPSPSSPLVGLLQLLRISDLQHLACTERANTTYRQVRLLLEFGRRKTYIDAASPQGYTHCEVCLAKLGRFRVNCAICSSALSCHKCMCRVTTASFAVFPFPQFHRQGPRRGCLPEPLRIGDTLCIVCYPSAASYEQMRYLTLSTYFYAILDGMLKIGAWSPLSARWGGMTSRLLAANRQHEERWQFIHLERRTLAVVPERPTTAVTFPRSPLRRASSPTGLL